MSDRLLPKGVCSVLRDLYTFWEIRYNILETVQDRHGCNGSLIGNRMWPIISNRTIPNALE